MSPGRGGGRAESPVPDWPGEKEVWLDPSLQKKSKVRPGKNKDYAWVRGRADLCCLFKEIKII